MRRRKPTKTELAAMNKLIPATRYPAGQDRATLTTAREPRSRRRGAGK